VGIKKQELVSADITDSKDPTKCLDETKAFVCGGKTRDIIWSSLCEPVVCYIDRSNTDFLEYIGELTNQDDVTVTLVQGRPGNAQLGPRALEKTPALYVHIDEYNRNRFMSAYGGVYRETVHGSSQSTASKLLALAKRNKPPIITSTDSGTSTYNYIEYMSFEMKVRIHADREQCTTTIFEWSVRPPAAGSDGPLMYRPEISIPGMERLVESLYDKVLFHTAVMKTGACDVSKAHIYIPPFTDNYSTSSSRMEMCIQKQTTSRHEKMTRHPVLVEICKPALDNMDWWVSANGRTHPRTPTATPAEPTMCSEANNQQTSITNKRCPHPFNQSLVSFVGEHNHGST
jgi:hypothetical protein